MIEELMEYRKRVAETVKMSEESAVATQQRTKEAAEVLTQVSETVAQRLAKLMRPLSINMQPIGNIPSLVQKLSTLVTSIFRESAFSNEFKHADIAVNQTAAIKERDTTGDYVCVMGVTVLDLSALGRTYRCRIKVAKKGQPSIGVGVASQQTLSANKFQQADWSKLGHGNYINFSHGTTLSDTDTIVNNKKGTLSFRQGDVIEMDFDTTTMALSIRCNGQQSGFAVAPPQKEDCYRFVAYLFDIG
jgi:hypothetical protein